MDTLFPQSDPEKCRVCDEPVVDGRYNYCSTRCREIAEAVQRRFIWDKVREQVLKRDDYTCQKCGLSKDRWWRAYWQIRERMDERNPYDSGENWDRWNAKQEQLRDAYGVESPSDGGFHVDHIQRIADDGHPLDETNLQTLCKYCHHEKTAEENSNSAETEETRPEIPLQEYIDS